MPVTIKPSPELEVRNRDLTVNSAAGLLRLTAKAWSPLGRMFNPYMNRMEEPEKRPIIQSSFGNLDHDSTIIPYPNGLVNGIIRTFEQDLHLSLRPDDIWLSILTQFSMFVNANADHLRAHFVTHEGQKDLIIDIRPNSVWSIDMGKFAQKMSLLIQNNVVDFELRDWIIPNFSTTTDNDKSVAAVVMMGTLQKYFSFDVWGGCGFPSVTLLGEKSDWEQILHKVRKLPEYGIDTWEWSRLLIPIVKHMIESFNQPNSQRVKDFWMRACHCNGRDGSDQVETLSGWITTFCFWKCPSMGLPVRVKECSHKYLSKIPVVDQKGLILDGIAYPIIPRRSIPKGVALVPVTLQDFQTRLEHATTLVAGSVGMTVTMVDRDRNLTKVQPRSGWWMLEDSVKPMSNLNHR